MLRDRISELSMDFAVRIIPLFQKLENEREYILSRQIRKSGTSIGAHVRESKYDSFSLLVFRFSEVITCQIMKN